ncbi:hypothetical protein LIA77_06993 [Sarocladium implicatum]|nr:hypothetical protein LIA77_06993 [Sarocladium implicatum]
MARQLTISRRSGLASNMRSAMRKYLKKERKISHKSQFSLNCVPVFIETLSVPMLHSRQKQPKTSRGTMAKRLEETNRPLKVVTVGLPRSGTTSLKHALADLGYKPHHLQLNWLELERWEFIERASDAHCPNLPSYTGKPFTPEQWDELLGPYDAVTDLSAALPFAFFDAFPDAKFILTRRDFDSWFRSLERTLVAPAFGWQGWIFANCLEPLTGSHLYRGMRKIQIGALGATEKTIRDRAVLRRFYDERHRRLRERIPKAQLLEFDAADGWEPLCQFLGKDVPVWPYPHRNKSESILEGWGWVRALILLRLGKRLGMVAATFVLIWIVRWLHARSFL